VAQHQVAAISRERTAWELGRPVGECAAQRRPGMLLIELGPEQRGQLVAGARALGQGQVGGQGCRSRATITPPRSICGSPKM